MIVLDIVSECKKFGLGFEIDLPRLRTLTLRRARFFVCVLPNENPPGSSVSFLLWSSSNNAEDIETIV